ncbi:MAG: hypothetical protein HYY52_00295 [Candidatus Melainabacteria bacterium]|nr:hypothetical protein [Candidatus Melainabacteria bacterium]
MKTVNKILVLMLIAFICFYRIPVCAQNVSEINLDIYKINLDSLDKFNLIKKEEIIDLVLLNDVFTEGKRFAMSSNLQLTTNKLYLKDGQEILISATSPVITSIHPPHANNNSSGIARALLGLSVASTPLTFGTSIGISFLISGLLSAYQNGISDFIWGGLNGGGFSFVEHIFRKQPDIFLTSGTKIPFVLNEDIKISKGIEKENIEYIDIGKEEAIKKINKLLEWGDLTGALELSVKTGQTEIYNEIIKKISL